jgi:disulfide bond formation protein DsbB
MNATLLDQRQQTSTHLTRAIRRWDRRLRVVSSLLWGPRGLMVGVLIGILIAMIARTRPWLFPNEVTLLALLAVAVSGLAALLLVWTWPRPVPRAARYFDHRFALQERVSTALELASGAIPAPDDLAARQLSDTVGTVRRVNAARWLPLRVRVWEVLALVALSVLLAFLLIADNPQADKLRAERDLRQEIDQKIEQVEGMIVQIENDDSLSPEAKTALTEPLRDALDTLKQPDISRQEAIAALAEAERALGDMADGTLPEQQAAYQSAAEQLAGSDLTSDLAGALREPDLNRAADAIDELADQLNEADLSPAEREALANELDQIADELADSSPGTAEKLREAAQALRDGDAAGAQDALRQAADQFQQDARQAQQALDQAQQSIDQGDAAQQQQAAQQLDGTANALDDTSPDAAQQMRQAAQQLRDGDTAGAQQRLDQAQQALDQSIDDTQQALNRANQNLNDSLNAQQQQRAQQLDQASQALAQANPQVAQNFKDAAQNMRDGEIAEAQQDLNQAAQSLRQQRADLQDSGTAQAAQAAQQQLGQGQRDLAQAGQPAADDAAAQQPGGAQQSPGQSGGQANADVADAPQDAAAGASSSADSDGEGSAGAGTDTTTGRPGQPSDAGLAADGAPDDNDDGGFLDYEPQADPSLLGGDSDVTFDVGTDGEPPTQGPMREGGLMELVDGAAREYYAESDYNYSGAVGNALGDNRLPLDQRDVIHDYFSSLP